MLKKWEEKTNAVKVMVPTFNSAYILTRTSSISQTELQIRTTSNTLTTAIQNGNRAAAFTAYNNLKSLFISQKNAGDDILLFTEDNEVYLKVKFELVDNTGNSVPATTLPDYFAQNQATNKYTYPQDRYNHTIIENLAPGTYMFGAMDGYWDGASSKIVAIDPSMVNANGYIVITLNYWSE